MAVAAGGGLPDVSPPRASATRDDLVRLEDRAVSFHFVRVPRRRSIQLRVHADGTVEVRGPWRASIGDARDAIRRHSGWLGRTLERLRVAQAARPVLADGVRLPLLGADLTLRLVPGPRPGVERLGDELRLTVRESGEAPARAALVRWYRREATARLPPRLEGLAHPLGVTPGRVAIRDQRTRWGSCSSRGTISLNWRLLLVPLELADYVLVHELCHLRHLSHSAVFWAMVEQAVPDWRARRARLRALHGTLPL